jgi:hypothetical protein
MSVERNDKLLGMEWPNIQSKVTRLREATSVRMKPEITPHYFAAGKIVCRICTLFQNNKMIYLIFIFIIFNVCILLREYN